MHTRLLSWLAGYEWVAALLASSQLNYPIAWQVSIQTPLRLSHSVQESAFASPFDSLLVAVGIGTGPPGESGNLAVSTSTPSSVMSRVCSILH